MDESEGPPSDDEVLEDLIDIREIDYEDRLYVAARIAPHPTAIRAIFEVPDEGEPIPKSASELVAEGSDPYFWVEQYGSLLRDYIGEVRHGLDTIVSDEPPANDSSGPVGQAFEPESVVGRAARQSAVGVRALTASFAEVVFHASSEVGWPEDAEECARLLDLFVDASIAASVLEQLGGQPAIPDDVLAAWDPTKSGE